MSDSGHLSPLPDRHVWDDELGDDTVLLLANVRAQRSRLFLNRGRNSHFDYQVAACDRAIGRYERQLAEEQETT